VLLAAFLAGRLLGQHSLADRIQLVTNINAFCTKLEATHRRYSRLVLTLKLLLLTQLLTFAVVCAGASFYKSLQGARHILLSKWSILGNVLLFLLLGACSKFLASMQEKALKEYMTVKQQENEVINLFLNDLPPALVDSLRMRLEDRRRVAYCRTVCDQKMRELESQVKMKKIAVAKLT
jgi:hypothetical protein